MEKNKDIQGLYKAQKVALYWLLRIIFSGFIGLQLGRIQAIADFNYNLHELMYIPFTIALFAAPALFVIYIFLLCKFLLAGGKYSLNRKTGIQSLFVIASIVVVISITAHQFLEVATAGVYEIEEKIHEDRKYFIVLHDKKIQVSNNEFQLIEKNQLYSISFVWNKRTPNIGKLKTIEPMR